ncbi:hypothetical protein BDY24DRAFT_382883 [Mrakia frigida]|uniref:uncharacterized protein n=1 Tax=Mrakia frigida TaxID=29902 RepID=UPI003FCC18C6
MSSKKKSAASKIYSIDDVVTHKMRGYPAWPGKIVAAESLSREVIKEKPRQGNFHCVRYYPKGDHSWASPRDLDLLEPSQIDAFLAKNKGKSSEIVTAYKTAKDPSEWEEQQQAKAEEFARKNAAVDELDEDEPEKEEDELDDGAGEEAAAGDKRKRAKAEKKPSSGKKVKVEKPKAEKKAKATTPAKSKSTKVKSSTHIESEEEDAKASTSNGKVEKVAASAPPPTGAADEETDNDSQKVKDWRHKLQRAFLGKAPPTEKDMPSADQMFTIIEAYNAMTITQLQVSKIGKVMRKIAALPSIPREEEFNFKTRAAKLMGKWQTQLNSAGANEDGGAHAANGKAEE